MERLERVDSSVLGYWKEIVERERKKQKGRVTRLSLTVSKTFGMTSFSLDHKRAKK